MTKRYRQFSTSEAWYSTEVVCTFTRKPAMKASFSLSSNSVAGIPVVSMPFTSSRKPSLATCASVKRKATCLQSSPNW